MRSIIGVVILLAGTSIQSVKVNAVLHGTLVNKIALGDPFKFIDETV